VVAEAEPMYRELRVVNKLEARDGQTYSLKKGALVDVIIEADRKWLVPKGEEN
jgi:hypothetical protein